MDGNLSKGRAGIAAEYEHRIRKNLSLFGMVSVLKKWGLLYGDAGLDFTGLVGLRMRF